MADVLPFPPPVTGVSRDADDYWHDRWVEAWHRFEDEHRLRLRAEAQRDAYFDRLCEHAAAIAEGRLATPGMVWARVAFAVFCTAVLVWPIARMVP